MEKRQCDGRFCCTLRSYLLIYLADTFLADVYRIPLSPSAIKARARSLESILDGVEITHPLVRAIRPPRITIISSLVYSHRLKFWHFCRLSRPSERNRPLMRKQGPRTQQKRNSPYEKNHHLPGHLPMLSSRHFSAGLSCHLCNPYSSPRHLRFTCSGPPL